MAAWPARHSNRQIIPLDAYHVNSNLNNFINYTSEKCLLKDAVQVHSSILVQKQQFSNKSYLQRSHFDTCYPYTLYRHPQYNNRTKN